MRPYTLAFSIVIHLLVVGALIVAPLVATDVLPEPRRAVEFNEVMPIEAPTLPAPRGRVTKPPSARVSPLAATPVAPNRIVPEPGLEPFETAGIREGVDGVPEGIPGSMVMTDALVPVPPPPPPRTGPPVHVGGLIREPRKIRDVAPVYPALALAARMEGIVILKAEIGEDGRVRNLRVLRSVPLLDQAAIDAVRQWQFTPTLLNGEPVPVVMTVTVSFTLQR